MKRVGFLVNPIAGMGGRVGLKGTDDVLAEAIARGARPSAHLRAAEMLSELRRLLDAADGGPSIRWLTCSGAMGAVCLAQAGFTEIEIVHDAPRDPGSADTRAAVSRFVDRGADLILFVGGDGTARDIVGICGQRVPILGVPAGVKMFSGVFAVSPRRAAELVLGFLDGRLSATEVDILDLDEDLYRRGELSVRLYASALTPYEPVLTQSAKMLVSGRNEPEAKAEIANTITEEIEARPDTLFLLGPGSTVKAVGDLLGLDTTLLGIDAVAGGELVARDLDESGLLKLLDRYKRARLVLSPIGAQGFVLGRGNLQLSPEVIRRIGPANIVILATPEKLAATPVLHFDTGDATLDRALAGRGYVPVVIGHRLRRLARVAL